VGLQTQDHDAHQYFSNPHPTKGLFFVSQTIFCILSFNPLSATME